MKDEVAFVTPQELEEKEGKIPVEKVGLEKKELLEQLNEFFDSQPLSENPGGKIHCCDPFPACCRSFSLTAFPV